MKTRILTLTGMVLIATSTLANAANFRVQNASAASSHENETRIENSALTSSGSTAMSISLEEWIAVRENWEQEGTGASVAMNAVSLPEWVSSRDNWEQDGEGCLVAPTAEKRVSLEEWIAGCESWEQESSEISGSLVSAEFAGMEEWIAELAIWEQK